MGQTNVRTLTASDAEPPPKKQQLNDSDVERIIMGEELTNVHINIHNSKRVKKAVS